MAKSLRLWLKLLYHETMHVSWRAAGASAELGMHACAVYRPVLTTGVSLCRLPCPIIIFGQGDAVSEVERKGNTVNGAGLGHCPSVSW